MSEIKVGDRVKIYGGDYKGSIFSDGEIGVIEEFSIKKNLIKIYFSNDGCYLFHRRQCRKLVKVRRCQVCKGSGISASYLVTTVENVNQPFARDIKFKTEKGSFKCTKCNGSGKVKVNATKT